MKKILLAVVVTHFMICPAHAQAEAMKLRTVELPQEVGSIAVPEDFTVKTQNETTMMAYPADDENITLWITSRIPTIEGGKTVKDLIRKMADQKGYPYSEDSGKGIASFRVEIEEQGEPISMLTWHVGNDTVGLILTAAVVTKNMDSELVKATLDAMPKVIESITFAQQ